ncbi:S1 family peptidase [Microbacterium sp. ZXX196]|uniref:S1 family peptidase n=1 Tax=Microbacterium sp. ZXX196 TaxID=2609291 RepID=UPI0012B85B4C|nr:S1 family peptidase [Microbacterium sp. ZXX196]MTE23460.1 hypothetical protein [Microbacterium sp. ZXX196]
MPLSPARRTAIALVAALAVTGAGVSAAWADGGTPDATLEQVAAEAFADPGVVAVTYDGADASTIVIHTDDAGAFTTMSGLALSYANVELADEPAEELVTTAATDVVGGAGTLASDGATTHTCSLGFAAWSPAGEPALLTAGHCTLDGALTDVDRSAPADEPAVGGDGSVVLDDLGTYGFSQFGGPGNTAVGAEVQGETDIAVIDGLADGLSPVPAVADWSTALTGDLAAGSVPVTGVGVAAVGDTVWRSGRSTGWRAGVVTDTGFFAIDGRVVFGHVAEQTGADPLVLRGDSGGPVVVGETAVGIVSGGNAAGDRLLFADLAYALDVVAARAGSYALMLDLVEPQLAEGAAEPGSAVAGTAPAGATVEVTGDIEATLEADGAGAFAFAAPADPGTYDVELVAARGYDRSDAVSATVTVAAPADVDAGDDAEGATGDAQGAGGAAGETGDAAGASDGAEEPGVDGEADGAESGSPDAAGGVGGDGTASGAADGTGGEAETEAAEGGTADTAAAADGDATGAPAGGDASAEGAAASDAADGGDGAEGGTTPSEEGEGLPAKESSAGNEPVAEGIAPAAAPAESASPVPADPLPAAAEAEAARRLEATGIERTATLPLTAAGALALLAGLAMLAARRRWVG